MRAVELLKIETGKYPVVSDSNTVSFTGAVIWNQWSFGIDSVIDSKRVSEVPTDPLTGNPYAYSTTQSTSEYQIGVFLEWGDVAHWLTDSIIPQSYAADANNFANARVGGNYNGVYIVHSEQISNTNRRVYVLGVPSILTSEITDVSLEDIFTNNSFVYSQKKGIPWPYLSELTNITGNWLFTPTQTQDGIDNSENGLVLITSSEELSTGTGRLDFIWNLKDYYTSSDISVVNGIHEKIHDLDISDSEASSKLAESIIYSWVGWLQKLNLGDIRTTSSEIVEASVDDFITLEFLWWLKQRWMKSNYNWGAQVPAQTFIDNGYVLWEWEKVCFEDNPSNCEKFGGLYTYQQALQICSNYSPGSYLPSFQNITDLVNNIVSDYWNGPNSILHPDEGYSSDTWLWFRRAWKFEYRAVPDAAIFHSNIDYISGLKTLFLWADYSSPYVYSSIFLQESDTTFKHTWTIANIPSLHSVRCLEEISL